MNDEWNGPNGQSCKNCFFWIDTACRRYPPVLVSIAASLRHGTLGDPDLNRVTTELSAEVPDTASDCWCGEWKGRG